MQRYAVIIERSDDEFFAYVPALPGCTSAGRSVGEALDNVREAIQLTIEYMREQGLSLPDTVETVAEVTA